MRTVSAFFALGTAALLQAPPAASETLLATFTDWEAFVDGKGKGRVCYLGAHPKKKEGKYKTRGDTYVLITHRPGERKRDVFELRAGYRYKKNSEVGVAIGGYKARLFTAGDTAWAKDPGADRALARAMIRGKTMVVRGTSSRGTRTTDTYSLTGFTAAYKAVSKACGVK